MKANCTICGKPTKLDDDVVNELVTGVRHNECQARFDLRRTVRPLNPLARRLIEERSGKAPLPSVATMARTIAAVVRLPRLPRDIVGIRLSGEA